MMLTPKDILAALSGVRDPDSGRDVVSSVSGVTVREGGRVGFILTVASPDRQKNAALQLACELAVKKLPGVSAVTVVMTNGDASNTSESSNHRIIESSGRKAAQWNTEPIAHVKRLIAVASGKGGVGKSTTAVNLAHALRASGKRVGLLDADIYGPSIPRMMGVKGTPETRAGKIIPPLAHGIPVMSMGLLVGDESALVWRGPQMSKALFQLLRGVEWCAADAPLDMVLIDMPPGTGDVHLSLAQQAPINGAIIVTTPQDVAVADARKCIDMFRKVHIPILGVIENMSGFTDPATGAVHAIFGEGGGRRLAESQNVPYLGEMPLVMELREASDSGIRYEDSKGIYKMIAAQL